MGRNALQNIDFPLLLIFSLIVIFGILNIHSVDPSSGIKQLTWVGIAVFLSLTFFIVQSIVFESISILIYGVGIVLLLAVLLFGTEINGAKAWFKIGSNNFQPVEMVKMATCIALAAIANNSDFNLKSSKTLLRVAVLLGLPIALIMLQPDFGSVLVFSAFFIALYREGLSGYWFILALYGIVLFLFSINYPPKYVIAGLLVFFILVFVVGYYLKYIRVNTANILALLFALILSAGISYASGTVFEQLPTHHKERLMVLFEGESKYRDTSGYNLLYAKSAIAVGRITGSGYDQGTVTKGKFVPEQRTDYIFCTVGEEWGFLGAAIMVILYTLFICRIYYLSEISKNNFLRVYGYSFGSIVLMHFLMNIGMVLGLFPTVGIPLPFFSYGGSSLLGFCLMFFFFLRLVYSDKSSLI